MAQRYVQTQTPYQHGTAAYAYPERRREIPERPAHRKHTSPKPHSFGIHSLADLGAVLFVVAAFAICCRLVVGYVGLRSEFTRSVKSVAAKQVELNDLRSRNDANYVRIMSSVDLQEIERVARGELGMTYAQEGQVIFYSGTNNDYMRKVGD